MSGVMIKMGIYGLLRVITFADHPALWWGETFVITGIISAIVGICLAMLQSNLKRLLAYSSIEHIGIIIFAIGLGLIGMNQHEPLTSLLGFGGALFHVMNHSLFKNLLFLGSGAINHATGSLDLNHLGGLIKKMPRTAAVFLVGVLAISAIPALNGFMSEFMIYMAAFHGILSHSLTASLAIILTLCMTGALTLAVFTGMFGTIFLGEPRTSPARLAHETGRPMLFSMFILALSCIVVACCFPFCISFLACTLSQIAKIECSEIAPTILSEIKEPLQIMIALTWGLIAIAFILFWIKRRRRLNADYTVTWDCGYVQPTEKMQYSFASFVQPLKMNVRRVLQPTSHKKLFPEHQKTSHSEEIDPIDYIVQHLLKKATRLSYTLRWIQHGYLNLYILYIFVTLLLLLIFKFR